MPHPRLAVDRLVTLARQFPAVGILGPRQIGKSTLARMAFPKHTYLDLEDPIDLDRLRSDPSFVFAQHERLIIDEAQRWPALFPVLRSHLDRTEKASVVLLGSAAPGMLTHISESLAGRIANLELGSLSPFEADGDAIWFRGGFPRVHWSRPRTTPKDWLPNYLALCLERDIPQLGFRISSLRLRSLMTMVAHGQGSLCNLSELGTALGISYHAVAHILDILEGVFLVRRLPPFFANIRKRLVKAPKLYVRDTGILHTLLGMGFTKSAILAHPKVGASFETYCVEQILSHAKLADPTAQGFFFRTQTGTEVDLLLEIRGKISAIEIKLGLQIPDVAPLQSCMSDLGLNQGYVVNAGVGLTQIRPGIAMGGVMDVIKALDLVPKGWGGH